MSLPVTDINSALLVAGLLLALSVVASKLSTRYGIPALVLFIGIGMLAGSEGFGGLAFDNYQFAYGLGVVALVLILFGGGLDTHWSEIKPVVTPGLSLATVGVAITAGIIGVSAQLLTGISLLEGLLLGAIVSSTDAAAVFGVLRAQKLKLKGRLTPLLEFESGSNDPMAVFLTFGLTGLLMGTSSSAWLLLPQLVEELLIGLVVGFGVGRAASEILNRLHLEYDGLYHVLTIATAFVAFGGSQALGGNGFLGVYVAGVALGSRRFVHRTALIQFHEGLGWLMQIAMFICLGLLVFPSELLKNVWHNLVLAGVLVFIARPIAVFLCLAPFPQLHLRKKLLISWVGLRGAVPIILATIPLLQGVTGAAQIFNAVFFIVIVSVTVQATSIGWVARRLGVVVPQRSHGRERHLLTSVFEIRIPENSPAVAKSVVELNLPEGTLLTLLSRDGAADMIPHGATIINAGDRILVRSSERFLEQVKEMLTGADHD